MQVYLAAKHSVIASYELVNQICTLKCFVWYVFITTITHMYIQYIPMSTSSLHSDSTSAMTSSPGAAPLHSLLPNAL